MLQFVYGVIGNAQTLTCFLQLEWYFQKQN